jgi:SAM-dependent methyltransferase
MIPLNDAFWSQRYTSQTAAWDLGQVSPPIQKYVAQITDKKWRILIPGCGNAYEALYLLEKGFSNITLIDISAVLVDKLKSQWGQTPINIIHGDFFDHHLQYDLILEQTFFCALHPSLRLNYALHMKKLLVPGGLLVGVLFDTVFESGPPFGGSQQEYQLLFEPHFASVSLSPCYNSIAPRAGKELFLKARA